MYPFRVYFSFYKEQLNYTSVGPWLTGPGPVTAGLLRVSEQQSIYL